MVDHGLNDIGKGLRIMTAEIFAVQQKHAAAKVFWQARTHDIAIINGLRADAGLPPVVHEENGAIVELALHLVTDE